MSSNIPAGVVADMLLALKAALPHVQRVAAQAPTTEARVARQRDAARALERMTAAIATAEALGGQS